MREVFDKLEQYESRFSGDVWNNVNKVLAEKRKKQKQRNLMFGLSLIIFMCSSVFVIYLSNQENQTLATVNQATVLTTNTGSQQSATAFHQEIEPLQPDLAIASLNNLDFEEPEDKINNVVASLGTNVNLVVNKSDIAIFDFPNSTQIQPTRSTNSIVVGEKHTNVVKEDYKSSAIAAIHNRDASLNNTSNANLKFNLNSIFTKGSCPTFGDANHRIYAWSQITGLFPLAQFNLSENSSDALYRAARETTEQGQLSGEGDIGLGLALKKGYYFETGVQYAHWREKFSYVDPESINYQTVITIDTIFQAMDTLITSDTTRIEVPGSRSIVHHNTHKSFNIPILFGFQQSINEVLSYSLKAGAIFNIQVRHEGRILDQNMIAKNLSPNEGDFMDVYKTKLSTQFVVGGQLNYHVTPEIHVYISPTVRFTSSDVTNESYALKQTYINPALSLGLKYFL